MSGTGAYAILLLRAGGLSMAEAQKPVTYIKAPIAIHYDYSVGAGSSTFLRAIRGGRILGARCPDTGKVYVDSRPSRPHRP